MYRFQSLAVGICCVLLGRLLIAQTYTVTDLGTLGGFNSFPSAINASGQITGYAATTSSDHAFLFRFGVMKDLGTLGGSNSFGVSINASGEVAGYAQIAGNPAYHAFLYTDGMITDLGTVGGTYSLALAMNDAGQITGFSQAPDQSEHGFLYSHEGSWNSGRKLQLRAGDQQCRACDRVCAFAAIQGSFLPLP